MHRPYSTPPHSSAHQPIDYFISQPSPFGAQSMSEVPVLSDPVRLPTDMQHGIGAAVKHALMFAPSMTDIIIHEGHVIRAKSARGTLPLHQLFSAIPSFIITREHIVTYLAGYVEAFMARVARQGRRRENVSQAPMSATATTDCLLHGAESRSWTCPVAARNGPSRAAPR